MCPISILSILDTNLLVDCLLTHRRPISATHPDGIPRIFDLFHAG